MILTCKDCVHIDICDTLRPIEYCMDITCSQYRNKTEECKDCAGCTSWLCDCSNIRAEAYEECIEKVKAYYEEIQFAYDFSNTCEALDGLLKELKDNIH